jgi:hypothetical protein
MSQSEFPAPKKNERQQSLCSGSWVVPQKATLPFGVKLGVLRFQLGIIAQTSKTGLSAVDLKQNWSMMEGFPCLVVIVPGRNSPT